MSLWPEDSVVAQAIRANSLSFGGCRKTRGEGWGEVNDPCPNSHLSLTLSSQEETYGSEVLPSAQLVCEAAVQDRNLEKSAAS